MDDKPRAELFGFPRAFVLGAFAVVVVVSLIAGLLIGNALGGSSTAATTFTPIPPTATVAATLAPTAANTPTGPLIIDGATLGGTPIEWTDAFGLPDTSGAYARYDITTSEGYPVVICFCDTVPGIDNAIRDNRLGLDPQSGTSVTATQLTSILPRYLPPDTKHVRDFTDPQIGLIHVYISADLATTFPPTDFTDSNTGATLPPGTFSAACNQPGPPECDVVLGD